MDKKYTAKELDLLHAELYDILGETIRICRKHDIPYFVIGGTAIGALYDRAILPWDDDIDIGMARKDYNRFLEVAPRELGDSYFLSWIETDPHSPYYYAKVKKNNTLFVEEMFKNVPMHPGIFVDIFPFDRIPDNKVLRKLQYDAAGFLKCCLMGKEIWMWKHFGKCEIEHPTDRGAFSCFLNKAVDVLFSKKAIYRMLVAVQSCFNSWNTKYFNNVMTTTDHVTGESLRHLQPVPFGPLTVNAPDNLEGFLRYNSDPAPIYRGRTGESEQSLPCRPFIQYDSKTRTMNMKPALVDVPVLILFFNRPQQLSQVFEQVKKARPSRLFLYQDGARNEHDLPGIKACREIVSQIDWECEVERFYQEKNFGCDPSEYISQKWAFSKVDKCIVLEDDDVPSVSFFRFCKEMLDKYEHDTRISMIAGFNPEEISKDIPYDYFFATTFSIWGWASWKRVVDQWDEFYTFLDDSFNMQQLEQLIKERKFRSDFIYMCRRHREHRKAFYETIFHASILFNSGLSIVPTRNMINNLGATADSTHFAGSVHTLPKGYRRIFTMKRYEAEFPLKHPRYVIENVAYKKSVYRIMCWDHPWIKIGRSFEELFLNLKYGNFSIITKAVKNRINKWLKRNKHH